MADDSAFSKNLFPKFQTRGCTICHDFYEENRNGLFFNSHEERAPDECVDCHWEDVTGFEHEDEWFAQPDLYTSGMDAKQTCEATKKAMHAEFKSETLLARQLEDHLLNDPRVLWGIDGATPKSGMLPDDTKEQDLVKGGMAEWKAQVKSWIDGGMKCD